MKFPHPFFLHLFVLSDNFRLFFVFIFLHTDPHQLEFLLQFSTALFFNADFLIFLFKLKKQQLNIFLMLAHLLLDEIYLCTILLVFELQCVNLTIFGFDLIFSRLNILYKSIFIIFLILDFSLSNFLALFILSRHFNDNLFFLLFLPLLCFALYLL